MSEPAYNPDPAGWVQGEPGKVIPLPTREHVADPAIPYGCCHCGCGGQTKIAKTNNSVWGHIKGEPVRYIKGHGHSGRPLAHHLEERGYSTPCWVYDGNLNPFGYGRASRPRVSTSRMAHRISWEWRHGPVPTGYELDHLCRQRDCINPDHLEVVTRAENCRRSRTTKLTLEIIGAIRADYEQEIANSKYLRNGQAILPPGAPDRLAAKYGIDRSHLHAICSQRLWAEDVVG